MNLHDTDEYRATKDWPYAISAGCVVYRTSPSGTEVLLLPRDSRTNNWGKNAGQVVSYHLPKGHCHVSETLVAAALRETAEEAGVNAKPAAYLGSREDNFVHPNTKINTKKVVHYFAAEWVSDIGSKDSEHDQPTWVGMAEAKKLLGEPNPKREDVIIDRFAQYLELENAA